MTKLGQEQYPALASQARQCAAEGLDALVASGLSDGRVLMEKGRDIKLEADIFLSQELTSRLTDATGIACVSEEDIKSHGFPDDELIWIVDPLDGSMNYARGVPLYCVSVALWQDDTPLIGLIHDIERNTTLVGYGNSSMRGEEEIHVREGADFSKAVLATGFPLLTDTSSEALGWFLGFANVFKKVRMLGTAALSMAWVAEGRLDAYFEKDIMIWDVAAGAALVRGAGGVCFMRPGSHPMSRDVLAANHDLAKAMQEILGW